MGKKKKKDFFWDAGICFFFLQLTKEGGMDRGGWLMGNERKRRRRRGRPWTDVGRFLFMAGGKRPKGKRKWKKRKMVCCLADRRGRRLEKGLPRSHPKKRICQNPPTVLPPSHKRGIDRVFDPLVLLPTAEADK